MHYGTGSSRTGVLCVAFAIGIAGVLAPARAQTFSEEAVSRGVVYVVSNSPTQDGAGIGLADLDNDGDPDLITLGASNGSVGLWENDGTGHFVNRTAGSGMPTLARPSGVSAADFDNDGDLDVHISVHNTADYLMRNDGGFKFVNVAAQAGVGSTGVGYGCAWGDYDGDGWVDLYVSNRTTADNNFAKNHLYRNNGDGTFTDVGEALGVVDGNAPTLVTAFLDYDRDGDADIYVGNDKGAIGPWMNRLYRNEGDGTFTDVTVSSGTGADVDCMGIAWGDFDRNGWMDIYVTNLPYGNCLLMNQGDGTFLDQTTVAGVGSFVLGWGTQFLDYDHDMLMDLFLVNTNAPSRMYRSEGVFPCVDTAPALGIADAGVSHTFTFALGDIDLDGDLDIVTAPSFNNVRVFINNASDGNWAKLRVVGQGNNGFGVGTILDARVGAIWQCRELQMGNNYKAQNDHLQHFGLGEATQIDELVVSWPTTGTTRTLTGYAANQTWTIYPPERLGDADADGDVDPHDYRQAVLACFGGGVFAPGCEVFDMDGDGDLDLDDLHAIGELAFKLSNRRLPGYPIGG